jgi:RNA polymerase sigma-70 factor, ECF subfamily
MDRTSQDLIAASRAGDHTALESLLSRHLGTLHGYLRLRCGPALREHESCSDLVQSVCREALSDMDAFEYQGEPAFRRWLFEAAERKIKDRARYWRRQKRDAGRASPLDAGSNSQAACLLDCYASFCTPSKQAIAHEQIERIERALDQLPEEYRAAIVLSRIIGLSNEELAAKLGESPAYTRTLLSRGLAKLSTSLDLAKPGDSNRSADT